MRWTNQLVLRSPSMIARYQPVNSNTALNIAYNAACFKRTYPGDTINKRMPLSNCQGNPPVDASKPIEAPYIPVASSCKYPPHARCCAKSVYACRLGGCYIRYNIICGSCSSTFSQLWAWSDILRLF